MKLFKWKLKMMRKFDDIYKMKVSVFHTFFVTMILCFLKRETYGNNL